MSNNRAIGFWLLLCCFMVFVMVVLGGMTRLTHSGLSIVEWKPISGTLPPLSQTEWEDSFLKYQATPEYKKINHGMSLEEYKGIFWLEFIHRLWGRLIGIVFLLPFLWFLIRGKIEKKLAPRLGLIFLLGAAQGVLGWLMVASGLVDRPSVSHYRLTAHLGMAFLVHALMFKTALQLIRDKAYDLPKEALGIRKLCVYFLALVTITFLSGGLVAGLRAGLIYNSFPLMGESLVPPDYFHPALGLMSIFEHVPAVQFNHRLLAEITVSFALFIWWKAKDLELPPYAYAAVNLMSGMALIQLGLGIATLIMVVPVSLGTIHQGGAFVLFTLAIWAIHELRKR